MAGRNKLSLSNLVYHMDGRDGMNEHATAGFNSLAVQHARVVQASGYFATAATIIPSRVALDETPLPSGSISLSIFVACR